MSPLALLSADPILRRELEHVAASASKRAHERDRWLARQIIIELAELLNSRK